jgi:putative endonuclease
MTFYVYMLLNDGVSRAVTYVGYTINISKRIRLHNTSKGAKFTRGKFWILIYKKKFSTKSDAMKYEYKLKKNYSLRKKIKDNFILKKTSNEIFKNKK